MKTELDVDEHKAVGPYTSLYEHGPVTGIAPGPRDGWDLLVCLDCGYTSADPRLFAHAECDTDKNGINTSWRERLRAHDTDFPGDADD